VTATISTPHLTLRPLTKATPRQVNWLRDPDVVKYSEQRHRDHSLSSQLKYIGTFGARSCIWGIHHLASGEHIGNISATHDEPNNVFDVGILLGETRFWGQGFGFEAWKHACDWLLDQNLGKARKLEAGCMKSNEAMMKIIRKSGFGWEGSRGNHFAIEGGTVSMELFGKSR
jgi:[ribosomal protein S5]-alanine N-acetyltransferase